MLIVFCSILQSGCDEQAMAPRQLSPDWFNQGDWPTETHVGNIAGTYSQGAPKILFEKTTYNLGEVGRGTNHLCEFRFKNTGSAPLQIGDVTRVCGCTPFLLEKREYAPGEIGTLQVRYYSDTDLGPTTKQLYLNSNDRTNPKVTLTIQAKVITKVDYEPKTLTLLLGKSNTTCPPIVINSVDNKPFSIEYFRSTSNIVTADFDPSQTATKFVIQPKVDIRRLEQNQDGLIEIGTTHPECEAITIGVNAIPKYKITPQSITVSNAVAKKPISKKVRITSNYNENFELSSWASKYELVKVVGNQKLRDGYELAIEITPPETNGEKRIFTEELALTTKGGDRLEIPLNGFYSDYTAPRRTARNSRNTRNTSRSTSSGQAFARNSSTSSSSKKSKDCPECGPKEYKFDPKENKASMKLLK